MPRPVCVPCGLFYRPKQNDIVWEEGMPVDVTRGWDTQRFAAAAAGNPEARRLFREAKANPKWIGYKLWAADLWRCEGCGHEMVTGHGRKAFAVHYEPDYEERRAAEPPIIRVDDC